MGSVLGFVIMIAIVLLVAALGMWVAQRIAARLDKHADLAQRNGYIAAPLSGASQMTSHPSPDGRYDLVTAAIEVRGGHWVETPILYDRQQNSQLMALDGRWSADVVAWSADSGAVTLQLRKYPADVPGVTLAVDLLGHEAQFQTRAGSEQVPLEDAIAWLDSYIRRFGV